jgi:hypothetical protein
MTTMDTNPHDGTGTFPDAPKRAIPGLQGGTGQFKFKLARNGIDIGWVGLGGSQSMWWCVVANESDATTWEWYYDSTGDYLKNPAWVNGYGTWSTSLAGHPCACNDWLHAGTFKLSGGHLIAGDGNTVGQYKSDLKWLYANSDYAALDFSYVKL